MSHGVGFEPHGFRFYDQTTRKDLMVVTEGAYRGWLVYKHVDGGWVTLRRATLDDCLVILNEVGKTHRLRMKDKLHECCRKG